MRYGYPEKVREDVKTLNEIIARQSTSLLIDVIAEYVGNTALKFNLREEERLNLADSLLKDFREELSQRI